MHTLYIIEKIYTTVAIETLFIGSMEVFYQLYVVILFVWGQHIKRITNYLVDDRWSTRPLLHFSKQYNLCISLICLREQRKNIGLVNLQYVVRSHKQ